MSELNLNSLELQDSDKLIALISEACRILDRRFDAGVLKAAQGDSPQMLDRLELSYQNLARIADRLYARTHGEEAHVNYFVDYGPNTSGINDEEAYARFMLLHFTLSATLQQLFKPFMHDKRLYCNYKNERYRVTGASRLGDIWLSRTLTGEPKDRYDLRVSVADCSNFAATV